MLNRVSKWREERKKRQAIQELHDNLLHLKNRKDVLGEDVEAEIEGVYEEFDKFWDPPDPIHKIGGLNERLMRKCKCGKPAVVLTFDGEWLCADCELEKRRRKR